MPLYEFYCEPCHTIFTFRSPRVDTVTVPDCPVCGAKLKREISPFAHIVKGKHEAAGGGDEAAAGRMDEVVAKMGDRLSALSDDDADPREAVKVMREMADAGGMKFNKEVSEAMARIEAGEDPEKIDEEFADVFDTENPFAEDGDDESQGAQSLALWRRLHGPRRDPAWRDMPERKDGPA